MTTVLRQEFRTRMAELEDGVLLMGQRVEELIGAALQALETGDPDAPTRVLRLDDEIDASHDEHRRHIVLLLTLQSPVASDLRLLIALLQANLHLERIGDYCVNVARAVDAGAARDAQLAVQVQVMGQRAARMLSVALRALRLRDVEEARSVPRLDDAVDELNRGLFRRLIELAHEDERLVDWAMRMVLVARSLERIGDHAVDIAEEAIYVITGGQPEHT